MWARIYTFVGPLKNDQNIRGFLDDVSNFINSKKRD